MKDFLARFTPSLMSPETLEAIFVQREKLAQDLVERVRDSVLTPAKHHVLLIGPRGMGKTHLVALVYHRVKKTEDLQDRMRIAWLREEEWGITSFLDLLLRILRALQEEHRDPRLAEKTEALFELSPDEAERAAEDLLTCYVGERTLLILVENLDDIFKGLGEEGQQQLRAFLQNHAFATILATSQSLFGGVSLRTSPFYGFFNVRHLPELDLDDATRLLTKISEHDEDAELAAFLQTPLGRARVRAVHHLAGGNPRVYLIFSQFLTREALDDLVEPFMQMLDDLTPYYQARMAWLSPQQRKIVEFLIENRGAAPVKAIAQRSFMTPQTASGQLKSLRDFGYVKSESAGRESYYELREPLMRLAIEVKKHRGRPIRLLLDFLRLWYTRPELEARLALLQPEAAIEREYVQYALAEYDDDPNDPRVTACWEDFKNYFDKRDFGEALQAAQELVELRGEAGDWYNWGKVLGHLRRYEEALSVFERAIALNPEDAMAWGGWGVALLLLDRWEEALSAFKRAIALNPEDAMAWGGWGVALSFLDRWGAVPGAFDDALRRTTEADHARMTAATGIVLRNLLVSQGAEGWPDRVRRLVAAFVKHEAASLLGAGLLASLKAMQAAALPIKALEAWKETWQQAAGDREEFQLPLRLLDAAIRYRETKDPRVLLALPVEERRILEEVLGLEEATAN